MSQKDTLLAEYDALEDAIEVDAAAATWSLADWLNEVDPYHGNGRADEKTRTRVRVSLDELAERGRRSLRQLQNMRHVAHTTAPMRLPKVTVRAYQAALEDVGWDLEAANASLQAKGTKLRDQTGHMMSEKAVAEELVKRPQKSRETTLKRVADQTSPEDRERMAMILTGLDRIKKEEEEQYRNDPGLAHITMKGLIAKASMTIDEAMKCADGVPFSMEHREFIVEAIMKLRTKVDALHESVVKGQPAGWQAELSLVENR